MSSPSHWPGKVQCSLLQRAGGSRQPCSALLQSQVTLWQLAHTLSAKPHEIAAVVVVVALLLSLHWGDVSMHVHLNPSFPNLMRADASSSSDASSSRRQALLAAAGAALVPCMPAAAFSLPGFGGQESAAPVAEPAPAVGVCLAAQNAAPPDHALPWHSLHVHQA